MWHAFVRDARLGVRLEFGVWRARARCTAQHFSKSVAHTRHAAAFCATRVLSISGGVFTARQGVLVICHARFFDSALRLYRVRIRAARGPLTLSQSLLG